MNYAEERSYLIVGLGRFGTALCSKLAELGQNVIGIDSSAAAVAAVADRISVAAQMDVTDEASLIKIGAKEVDVAVVTIGEAVEPSVLCTSLLVEIGVPKVIARASNRLHARVLERVGAHSVISPEYDMGARIGELLVYPWYSSFTRIDGGNFVVGKILPIPEMVGKSIAELKFSQKYKVIVILMEYGGKQHIPDPARCIDKADMLWVQGTIDDIDRLVGSDSASRYI